MRRCGKRAIVVLAESSIQVDSIAPRVALVGIDAATYGEWIDCLRQRCLVSLFEEPELSLRRLETESFEVVVLASGADDGELALLRRLRHLQPAAELIVVSRIDRVEVAVTAMRHGASDVICWPLPSVAELTRRIDDAVARALPVAPSGSTTGSGAAAAGLLDGESPEMQHVRKLIARFAGSPLPVMILGRSGTGKELAARALHAASPRAERPFVAINCAGLSESLVDSELFGHERGAFTGAQTSHKGLFDSADGGTLFLDEIGDVAPQTQVRLLRALQEGEVRPVGASRNHHVDVRVISATNADLKQAIAAGRFRQDLYFRLSPIKLEMPPLRARGRDVILLAEKLVAIGAAQARRRTPRFSKAVLDALLAYDWPGNVRELKSAVEYALSLSRGDTIEIEDLPPSIGDDERCRGEGFAAMPATGLPAPHYMQERRKRLAEFDRRYFEQLLRGTKGNLSEAARHSGVDRSNLRRILKEIGIDATRFRAS
jgi:two-component system response regulator HydG